MVKPDLLVWARETAGLDLETSAKRIGTSVERMTAWEDDATKDLPTVKQLRKMATVYKRPMGVFYLQDRPYTFQALRDYRRLPGTGMRSYSPELLLEQRLAYQRREQALELAAEIEIEPPAFCYQASLGEDPESIGVRIREVLEVSLDEQLGWPDDRVAFNSWRQKIENLGVMVFQMTQVASDEVSGFAICEESFPVVAINRKSTPHTRRSFSLFHEFAHLLLRESGISESDVDSSRPPEEQKVEIWCNAVAAATLMPRDAFLGNSIVQSKEDNTWSEDEIRAIARDFSVSRESTVRRLNNVGLATQSFYRVKRQKYALEWQSHVETRRLKLKNSKFQKNPAQEVLSDFGKPFVRLVLNSFYDGRITLSDVASYLNVRVRHIPTIEQRIGIA